jgi:ubiquinone/menaquinone biosynthesis C-methylase UbiE
MDEDAKRVAAHYESALSYELERLDRHSPIEFGITKRAIARHVRDGAAVVEIGVGAGHYSEVLARRGCRLILVDIVQPLLDAAVKRLTDGGLASAIEDTVLASATDLRTLPDWCADAVLMLGPLYHLKDPAQREQAVLEAARLLDTDGVVLAAGVNRLAFLRELTRDHPAQAAKLKARCSKFLEDGNLDPEIAQPIGHAHLTTAARLAELMSVRFEQVELLGTESFAAPYQDRLANLPDADREHRVLDRGR